MHFDTVLLEFEGVLADTAAPRRAALLRALADDGVELAESEYARAATGFPAREGAVAAAALRRVRLDETALDLVALRAERYFFESLATGVSLAPGARGLVESIVGQSRLAIVTRASRREVDFVLDLAGLAEAFEVIVARDDILVPKPSPEGYEKALQRLARRRRVSRPTTSIALEDSAAGILAARAVKIPVVTVGTVAPFHAVSADAHLPSLVGQTHETLTALIGERLPSFL